MIGVGTIALVVPSLLIVNTFRILANDWFVKTEITQRGLPADRYGLTTDERLELALVGLRAIQPSSEGIRLLERATLPDGSPAFDGTSQIAAGLAVGQAVVLVLASFWWLRRSTGERAPSA